MLFIVIFSHCLVISIFFWGSTYWYYVYSCCQALIKIYCFDDHNNNSHHIMFIKFKKKLTLRNTSVMFV